ncbi:MAG: TonB-dependent receptor [Candidatus Marinimicrobia bacterium]|nr:TonB-dependent receptor [Candidatus Neomarinimicrobiota bacterium]
MKHLNQLFYLLFKGIILFSPLLSENSLFFLGESFQDSTESQFEDISLNELPLPNENNAYNLLFPGTVTLDYRGDDYLHIRGSRMDEIGYQIEGIDIRNIYTGQPLFQITPESIHRIHLNTSPSASEGSERAIIQHTLNSQNPNRFFNLHLGSDNFTSMYQSRFDTYSYGWNSLSFSANSGLLWDKLNFYVLGKSESYQDHYRMYWDGFSLTDENFDMEFYDQTYYSDSLGQVIKVGDRRDIDELTIKPGNIPEAVSAQNTIQSVTTFNYNEIKIKAVYLYQSEKKRINNTPIKNIFNYNRLPEEFDVTSVLSFQVVSPLPYDFQLQAQMDFMNNDYSQYDPNFGDDFWNYRDSASIVEKGLDYSTNYNASLFQFDFVNPGYFSPGYSKQTLGYNNFVLTISKDIKYHSFKINGNFQKHTFRKYEMNSPKYISYFLNQYSESSSNNIAENDIINFMQWPGINTIGYDIYGNEIEESDSFYEGPRHPTQLSLSVSDQIKYKNIRLELGLRYQQFYSDALMPKDSASFELNQVNHDEWVDGEGLKNVPPKSFFMPRINLEIDINKKLKLISKYGTYSQLQKLDDVFQSRWLRWKVFNGGYYMSVLNPLEFTPTFSKQFELGLRYKTNNLGTSATIFTVDTKHYLQGDTLANKETNYWGAYPYLASSGSSLSNGIELTIDYRKKAFQLNGNYTFSDAKGDGAYPVSNNWIDEQRYYEAYYSRNKPLDYNYKHVFSFLGIYKTSSTTNFLFKNMSFSLIESINSGHHVTLYEAFFG